MQNRYRHVCVQAHVHTNTYMHIHVHPSSVCRRVLVLMTWQQLIHRMNALPNTVPHYKATTVEFLFPETQTPEMAQRKQKVDLNDGAF